MHTGYRLQRATKPFEQLPQDATCVDGFADANATKAQKRLARLSLQIPLRSSPPKNKEESFLRDPLPSPAYSRDS